MTFIFWLLCALGVGLITLAIIGDSFFESIEDKVENDDFGV